MKGSDINRAILIFFLFSVLYLVNILSVGIKKIQNKWPIYRCNPGIMPFAGIFGKDTVQNFVGCIQNMQSLNMDYLLKPIKYNIELLSDIGGQFHENLSGVQGSISTFRETVLKITDKIYSLLSGLISEIQVIITKIKDLARKLAGALIVILYMAESSIILTESAYNVVKPFIP